ncbi:hypothetical protein [Bradyrhizobium pachyrhizi]|uniref:hypothetical protein n=1 Tax=Bradyrhizobium pachyrhizi TaxID=280333 RepID=UPI0018E03334
MTIVDAFAFRFTAKQLCAIISLDGNSSTEHQPPERLSVTVFCHPLRSSEVSLKSATSPIPFTGRINVKNNARYLAPIYTLGFGVKQSPVCSQMLFVIDGQVPAPDGAVSSTVG